ncbi:hypothetical protein ACLB6K_24565 (plasmid) [Microcystis aeruginosa FACHB-524]|uniref:hypothetical protein n=1 Tax=Microcystis aeruginosa TaxID=1126 RepID=UPI0011CDF87F|nr:hypothetical protein [Microcystis aeruginosa]
MSNSLYFVQQSPICPMSLHFVQELLRHRWGLPSRLEYCGVGEAIAVLREQYLVGTVTAKIVQPKPDELKILP